RTPSSRSSSRNRTPARSRGRPDRESTRAGPGASPSPVPPRSGRSPPRTPCSAGWLGPPSRPSMGEWYRRLRARSKRLGRRATVRIGRRRLAACLVLGAVSLVVAASRRATESPAPASRPRLLVVIALDGVSWDMLWSSHERLHGGLARLLAEGGVEHRCSY